MAGGASRSEKIRAASTLTLLFAAVAIITSFFMAVSTGASEWKTVPKKDGIYGPIEIDEPGQVLLVEVRQPIKQDNVWSFVTGELLDAQQEYLFSFGEELWQEAGYDGGHWRESKESFDTKLTIPEKGTYYLSFSTETGRTKARRRRGSRSSSSEIGAQLKVRVEKKAGSGVPLFAAGFLAIILGLVMRATAAAMDNSQVSI